MTNCLLSGMDHGWLGQRRPVSPGRLMLILRHPDDQAIQRLGHLDPAGQPGIRLGDRGQSGVNIDVAGGQTHSPPQSASMPGTVLSTAPRITDLPTGTWIACSVPLYSIYVTFGTERSLLPAFRSRREVLHRD